MGRINKPVQFVTDANDNIIGFEGFEGALIPLVASTPSSSANNPGLVLAPLNTIANIGKFDMVSNFARSRAKKARVAAGLGTMKTAVLGDSTEAAIYALGTADPTTGVKKFSPCSRMAALVNSTIYPANSDSAWCDNNSGAVQTYDPRVFFNSGVTSSTTIRSIAGWVTTTATNPLYFTPRNFADTVDLYYIDNNATFNLSRVGDVTGPLVNGGNTGAVMKATLTFSTRTVTAAFSAKPASGTLLIVGIVCYDSTKPCVQFFNWGWSGGAAADWANTTNLYSVANAVVAVAPDLTFFTPGINDWSNNTGVPAFEANIDLVVKRLLISGDVVLSTSVPSQNSAYPLANQKLYVDAIIRVAAANPGVMLNDSWGRWHTWEEQNDFGFYTNNLHPNVAGYYEKGQGYARIFESI